MWWRVSRTGGRTDTSPLLSPVFFSLYKLPKTVTVTILLLSGHVTLLCWTFLFILLSEGPMQLSDCPIGTPSINEKGIAFPFTLVQFANTAPLIQPPGTYQCQSKISPFTASETLTQRRRRRIGARSPHPNHSVNGASSDNMYKIFWNNTSFRYLSSLI